MAITIEVDFRSQRFQSASAGLGAYLQALNKGWDGSAKELRGELQEFLKGVADALAVRHSTGWPGGTTDKTLSSRTGDLIQAIQDSVIVTGDTWATITGSIGAQGIIYAGVQEYGATIVAKDKKLTIPLPAALDSRGVPLKKSAKDWDNTFVAKSKAGNLIIFQKQGSKNIIPLYVLKDSVTIPPRLGLRDTIDRGIPYFVDQAIDRIVKKLQEDTH